MCAFLPFLAMNSDSHKQFRILSDIQGSLHVTQMLLPNAVFNCMLPTNIEPLSIKAERDLSTPISWMGHRLKEQSVELKIPLLVRVKAQFPNFLTQNSRLPCHKYWPKKSQNVLPLPCMHACSVASVMYNCLKPNGL